MAWTECPHPHIGVNGEIFPEGRYADCDEVSFDGGDTWVRACRDHHFTVETGKGKKGKYTTLVECVNLAQAAAFYRGIYLSAGHKKRLRIDGRTVAMFYDEYGFTGHRGF